MVIVAFPCACEFYAEALRQNQVNESTSCIGLIPLAGSIMRNRLPKDAHVLLLFQNTSDAMSAASEGFGSI